MDETWKQFVISALRENILWCKVGFGTFTRSNAEKENDRKLCCSSYAEIHNHRSVLWNCFRPCYKDQAQETSKIVVHFVDKHCGSGWKHMTWIKRESTLLAREWGSVTHYKTRRRYAWLCLQISITCLFGSEGWNMAAPKKRSAWNVR